MTANQISYWKLQEEKRSNLAKEAETLRSNTAREKETERSNRASETIDSGKLNESIRHNVAAETLQSADVNEKIRHNVAGELIDVRKQDESERHNTQTEAAQILSAYSHMTPHGAIATGLTRDLGDYVDDDSMLGQMYQLIQLVNQTHQARSAETVDNAATNAIGTLSSEYGIPENSARMTLLKPVINWIATLTDDVVTTLSKLGLIYK